MADDDFQKQLHLEDLEKSRKEQSSSGGSDPYIYTDPSGTVYEWNTEKHAWFPKIDDDFIAQYQSNYNYEEPESQNKETADAPPTAPKTGEKRKANDPSWFQVEEDRNTNVYVSGLPLDTTDDEFIEFMGKCGLIMKDPDTMKYKAKLYRDKNGELKGDGRCCYIKIESVKLALDILDGYLYKGKHKIHVERAQFELKGQYDPSKKPRKKKSRDKEKLQKKLDKRKKNFYVIKFMDESNTMSVVPRSWVKVKNGTSYCCWPSSNKNMTEFIKCEASPHPNWKFSEAAILFKSCKYQKAGKYLELSRIESWFSATESECESEDSCEEAPPISNGNSLNDVETALLYHPILDISSSSTLQAKCDTCINMEANFKKVFSLLKDLKQQVTHHSVLLQSLTGTGPLIPMQEDFDLPVNDARGLKELEEILADEEQFMKLVQYLGTLGGKNYADCSRRVMSSVIGYSLALNLSWQGTSTKTSVKQHPRTVQLMTAGIRAQRSFSGLTQQQFEGYLKTWLRNAPDRNGGRTKRRKKR